MGDMGEIGAVLTGVFEARGVEGDVGELAVCAGSCEVFLFYFGIHCLGVDIFIFDKNGLL